MYQNALPPIGGLWAQAAWIDLINGIPLHIPESIHRSGSHVIPAPRITREEEAQPRIHVARPQVDQARGVFTLSCPS